MMTSLLGALVIGLPLIRVGLLVGFDRRACVDAKLPIVTSFDPTGNTVSEKVAWVPGGYVELLIMTPSFDALMIVLSGNQNRGLATLRL